MAWISWSSPGAFCSCWDTMARARRRLRARCGGADITARTPAKNVAAGIAFIPQGHGIFRTLTVEDNLELGAFSEADTSRLDERRGLVYEMFPILHERA